MTMTSIVICVLLEMLTSHLYQYRRYDWAETYVVRVKRFFKGKTAWESPWGTVIVLLLPLLLVAVLQSVLSSFLLGFFALLFSILVLGYCLRYQPIDMDLKKISLALENRDVATASYLAAEFLGHQPDTEKDLVRQVCSALLVNVNERLFAVVLWFVILGPVGALLYRLSWFYSQRSQHAHAGFKTNMSRLHAILNWLPARLLPLGYAVAGNFDDALRGWREVRDEGIEDIEKLNHAIITHTACSALNLERYIQTSNKPDAIDLEVEAIEAAHSLIMRAILAWGIIISLLTLAGWAT